MYDIALQLRHYGIEENRENTIAMAIDYERKLLGAVGKKKRKSIRKYVLESLAKKRGQDRKALQRQIRNKFNGSLPVVSGNRVSYLTGYMLQQDPGEKQLDLKELEDPYAFFIRYTDTARRYGYSYGNAARPSMRLHTQYCTSIGLEQAIKRCALLLSHYLELVERYKEEEPLSDILYYKAPGWIRQWGKRASRHSTTAFFRPDLVYDIAGRLKATEIESAPGGAGILSVHELSFFENSDLVAAFAKIIGWRPFRVVICPAWLDYVWEQAAFCKMLSDLYSIDAAVIVATTEKQFEKHFSSSPHNQGETIRNCMDRVRSAPYKDFVRFDPGLAEEFSETVIYRFGYLHNFTIPNLVKMEDSYRVLNGMRPYLESKNLLALAWSAPMAEVYRQEKKEDEYQELCSVIAKTELLAGNAVSAINKVIKIAGWHAKDWGGRSLRMSCEMKQKNWQAMVRNYQELQRPAIIQDYVRSAEFPITYIDSLAKEGVETRAKLRITPFIVNGDPVTTGITYRNEARVHGATNAIQGILSPMAQHSLV